ncbi:MAG: hypothetical protein EHM47_14025, partial [Ignavibacteriales bacterium]
MRDGERRIYEKTGIMKTILFSELFDYFKYKQVNYTMSSLEKYFQAFRENTVGYNQTFASPYGEKRIIYADWIDSGRLYASIEKTLLEKFGPFIGNTHSESSITGTT